MKFQHLLVLALAAALILAFGCQKKAAPTVAPTAAVVEPPPEEPVVATPDAAGAKPVAAPPEVAKTQLLDGLTYTIAVIGWDNPFAVTMTDRALANVTSLTPEAKANEKEALAKAEVDLGGVKSKLDGVIKANGTLTQEELNALKDTLKSTRSALAALYAPKGAPISEELGKKMKEGEAMKEKKEKEGGDMLKKKAAEGGK